MCENMCIFTVCTELETSCAKPKDFILFIIYIFIFLCRFMYSDWRECMGLNLRIEMGDNVV